ncbi:formylglycine-generating enzyme family protein [Kaarinaea lacus]
MRTFWQSGWFLLLVPLIALLMESCAAPGQNDKDLKQLLQEPLANGGLGPRVLLIPAGEFMMGSPEDEPGRYMNEGPVHRVKFKRPFYLGMTEVTVGQFRKFVEATGYQTDGERNTGSFLRDISEKNAPWRLRKDVNWRMDHEGKPSIDENPVVHVSWNDAQAYIAWLSEETGEKYRLPSEAELEYSNRAGSKSMFWWGDGSPQDKLTNVRGDKDKAVANPLTWERLPGEQRYAFSGGDTPKWFENYGDGYHGLAPVGSFSPNPFGLHDTTGNVWEWVEDCWHENYNDAPDDGSAWVEDGYCNYRIVRGGSYYCYPRHVRSANRWPNWPEIRSMYIGFRIARDP